MGYIKSAVTKNKIKNTEIKQNRNKLETYKTIVSTEWNAIRPRKQQNRTRTQNSANTHWLNIYVRAENIQLQNSLWKWNKGLITKKLINEKN